MNSHVKKEKPFFFQDILGEMKTEQHSREDSAINESHEKNVHKGGYLYLLNLWFRFNSLPGGYMSFRLIAVLLYFCQTFLWV